MQISDFAHRMMKKLAGGGIHQKYSVLIITLCPFNIGRVRARLKSIHRLNLVRLNLERLNLEWTEPRMD
jgi:hypothetical protein